jgi:hypothetical protein
MRIRKNHSRLSVAGSVGIVFLLTVASVVIAFSAGLRPASGSGGSGGGSDPASLVGSPPAPITLSDPYALSGEYFGASVAISGNLTVVGAPIQAPWGNAQAGMVFLTDTQTGATLGLWSPNSQTGGEFGYSVALSGTTLVVGAPTETAADPFSDYLEAGNAYVYHLSFPLAGTQINAALIAQLTSPNPQGYSASTSPGVFGDSVAVSGSTVVVGAPQENASGVDEAGHVYIFNATTGLLAVTLSSPPVPSGSAMLGGFGDSVGVSGDTVIVGAPDQSVYSYTGLDYTYAGRAYEFNSTSGALVGSLVSSDLQNDARFGASVAVSGTTAVIGSPDETVSSHASAGSAYVLNMENGTMRELVSPHNQTDGYFGTAVAVSGITVVVGAFGEADYLNGLSLAGNAYAFNAFLGPAMSTSFTSPEPTSFTKPVPGGGQFGLSVGVSGSSVIIGASLEGAGWLDLYGHAYVFQRPAIALTGITSNGLPLGGEEFGNSVAVSGSIIVVGGDYWYNGVGSVWIFNTQTDTSLQVFSPYPQAVAFFGSSVGVSGNVVVVGEPDWNNNPLGYTGSGSAFLFNALTGALIGNLTDPSEATDANFGYAVAISGSTVLASAPGAGGTGVVYEYAVSAPTMATAVTVSQTLPTGAQFGASVALNGTTAIVGATLGVNGGDGGAYLIDLAGSSDLPLQSSRGMVGGEFGYSVAIDSSMAIVGAPYETSHGNLVAGNAYVFNSATGALIVNLTSPNPSDGPGGASAGGWFGASVAIGGVTAAVGASREYSLIAPNAGDSGNLYIFDVRSGGAANDAFSSPNPTYPGMLGTSVAIDNSVLVAGAWGETALGFLYAGHAYII